MRSLSGGGKRKDMNDKTLRGILMTIASALLFGVTPVLASLTYDMGSNANTLTFYRNLLVVPVLLAVMLVRRIPFGLTKKQVGLILLVGVVFRASTTLMLYSAYPFVGIGTATTLHFMYPVFTALICFVFFRERLAPVKLAALAVASLGVCLFAERGASDALPGVALALTSALTYSCYMTGMGKTELCQMNATKVACYMGLTNAAAMLAVDGFAHRIVFRLPPLAMLYTFIIAMCTSFLAVFLLQKGIACLGAPTAAIFSMFEPLTSVISGRVFLGEIMSLRTAIGCCAILGAVTLLVASDRLTPPAHR